MNKKIIGVYNLANSVTCLGVVFAVCAICLLGRDTSLSLVCLIISGVCDMFDGKVARMFDRTEMVKRYGIEIDSLADVVNFVLCPACVLIYVCGNNIISDVIGVLYVLSGLTRLAWFNITTDGDVKYYQGLPVTCSSFIVPFVYTFLYKIFAGISCADYIFMAFFLLMAGLFILNVKIKKLTGIWYVIFSVIAVITVGLLIVL